MIKTLVCVGSPPPTKQFATCSWGVWFVFCPGHVCLLFFRRMCSFHFLLFCCMSFGVRSLSTTEHDAHVCANCLWFCESVGDGEGCADHALRSGGAHGGGVVSIVVEVNQLFGLVNGLLFDVICDAVASVGGSSCFDGSSSISDEVSLTISCFGFPLSRHRCKHRCLAPRYCLGFCCGIVERLRHHMCNKCKAQMLTGPREPSELLCKCCGWSSVDSQRFFFSLWPMAACIDGVYETKHILQYACL